MRAARLVCQVIAACALAACAEPPPWTPAQDFGQRYANSRSSSRVMVKPPRLRRLSRQAEIEGLAWWVFVGPHGLKVVLSYRPIGLYDREDLAATYGPNPSSFRIPGSDVPGGLGEYLRIYDATRSAYVGERQRATSFAEGGLPQFAVLKDGILNWKGWIEFSGEPHEAVRCAGADWHATMTPDDLWCSPRRTPRESEIDRVATCKPPWFTCAWEWGRELRGVSLTTWIVDAEKLVFAGDGKGLGVPPLGIGEHERYRRFAIIDPDRPRGPSNDGVLASALIEFIPTYLSAAGGDYVLLKNEGKSIKRRIIPDDRTEILALDHEAQIAYRNHVNFPVSEPAIDGGGSRIYLVGRGLAALDDGMITWEWTWPETSFATAFEDGSLALTRGGALIILSRDGEVMSELHTEGDAAIITQPAPASDGSVWFATEKHLYVAR